MLKSGDLLRASALSTIDAAIVQHPAMPAALMAAMDAIEEGPPARAAAVLLDVFDGTGGTAVVLFDGLVPPERLDADRIVALVGDFDLVRTGPSIVFKMKLTPRRSAARWSWAVLSPRGEWLLRGAGRGALELGQEVHIIFTVSG